MLSNLVDSLPKADATSKLCTLCGLMCDLDSPITSHCDRRNRWNANVPQRGRDASRSTLSQQLSRIKLNADTLIWLDACDVQTTRAAIQLARRAGLTIHVGQSTGAHATKRVMASEGWFGTTLAEISARSELIVSLGDGVRRESPLLAERFFQSHSRTAQPVWLHISEHATPRTPASEAAQVTQANEPQQIIHWPREKWFDNLSQVALSLLQSSSIESRAPDATVPALSAQLLAAKQTVWVWDIDDLHFQSDELIVRRMLSIAKTLNEQMRCGLLPLDMNLGRVTAEETLLWMTGCPTTATWSGSHWYRSPRFADFTLEQWTATFSSIIVVSSLDSDRSLPNLPADLTIQTAPASQDHEIQVAAVGRDCPGHLFRGDRGAVLFADATSTSELPTAAEVLTQLMEHIVAN